MKSVEKIILFLCSTLVLNTMCGCKKNDDGIVSVAPSDSIPQLSGWKLVWNDEFNGTKVDTGKWEFEVTGNGGGNQREILSSVPWQAAGRKNTS